MSSLRWVPLRPILDGDPPDLRPTVLHTSDGKALLYPGINAFVGEPSTGKTLIAEAGAVEMLAAGGSVIMLDWEDTAATFVQRMRALGAPDETLNPRNVHYFSVDGALDDHDRNTVAAVVEALQLPTELYDDFELIVADDTTRTMLESYRESGGPLSDDATDEARRAVVAYSRDDLREMAISTADELPAVSSLPLEDRRPVLVIVDGYAAALAADGVPENDNGEVTAWTNTTLRPLARAGAVVLVLDHVTKDAATRTRGGRGAGAKLALVDGVALEVRLVKVFSRDHAGTVKLVIAKDRPGLVGPIGATAALVHLTPTGDGGLDIRVEPPERTATDSGEFRPTTLMERASIALERLETAGERLPTAREIELDHVEGKSSAIRAGLRVLIEEGYVERIPDGKRIAHRSVRPYRADQDSSASPRPERVPTASRTRSDPELAPASNPSASPRPNRVPTASRDALEPSASPRPCVTTTQDAGRGSTTPIQPPTHTTASPHQEQLT